MRVFPIEIALPDAAPTGAGTMFVEEIRRAVMATPRHRLAEMSATVWKSYAAGALTEDDAQRLAEEIEARKVAGLIQMDETAPRRVGSRPRSSASMARRRSWSAGGWLPPSIAAQFTASEAAVIAVILGEVSARGGHKFPPTCELHVGAIAARAGVSETTVRNARRQAERLGLIRVEQRRVSYSRSLPNRISVVSKELLLWLRTRSRAEKEEQVYARHGRKSVPGGGCKIALPTTSYIYSYPARPAAGAWKAGLAMGGAARSGP